MRRSRGLAAPVLATLVLAAVAGCSDHRAGASAGSAASASPSTSASATPTASEPPSSSPSPSSTSVPQPACQNTAVMDTRTRYRFLLDGPGDVLRNQRTLYLKPEGVFFGIRTLQRPCEPQEVAVTRFRVVTRAEVQKDRKTGQTYDLSFAYEALGVRKFTVGAGDGLVGDSRPPAPTACEGTLSVLHLGDEIKKDALPEQLDFRHSGSTSADGGATSVKVAGDLVLDAQFLPPTAPDTCKG